MGTCFLWAVQPRHSFDRILADCARSSIDSSRRGRLVCRDRDLLYYIQVAGALVVAGSSFVPSAFDDDRSVNDYVKLPNAIGAHRNSEAHETKIDNPRPAV